VFSRLDDGIDLLKVNDRDLIDNHVHERTISSRLAMYLQGLFPTYHVDVEYNRNEILQKILPRECHGTRQGGVFPDIIVHRRGSNEENLLVIEMKKAGNEAGIDCDKEKVRLFIKGDFHYRFGALIVLGNGKRNYEEVAVNRFDSASFD